MIEDKKLGLKIAESEDEVFWEEVRKTTEEDIGRLNKLLKFQKSVLKMCKEKLKNA